MSVSLVSYSSEEEVETHAAVDSSDDASQDDDQEVPAAAANVPVGKIQSQAAVLSPNEGSLLPSPDELFSEVTGPPEYLKSTVAEPALSRQQDTSRHSTGETFTAVYRTRATADEGQLPSQKVVVAARPKLVTNQTHARGIVENGNAGSKDAARAGADEGPALPRDNFLCSLYRGPVSLVESSSKDGDKRNKSKIKEKERSKRMKGQSSHATWKTETEMHLRQQFD